MRVPEELVLVVGGEESNGASQVIDLQNENRSCQLENYPRSRVITPSGGVLDNFPVVCGGHDSRITYKECNKFEHSTKKWKRFAQLPEPRTDHAIVAMDNSLWITGGDDKQKYDHAYKTTEFLFSNGTVKQGPDLPYGLKRHCMVKLDDGKVMLISGEIEDNNFVRPSDYQKKVLIYDPKQQSFKESPKMEYDRRHHTCAIFHSPRHGGRPIVMVAGGDHHQVEVLDYTKPDAKWEESK